MPLLALALSTALTTPPDPEALRSALSAVPTNGSDGVDIDLPMSDGGLSRFHLVDSRTLPASLMRRYPGLRSFRGHDATGRSARLDVSRSATHLSLRDGNDTWTLRLNGHDVSGSTPVPPRHSLSINSPLIATRPSRQHPFNGATHHDFRIAVASTSRRTAKFGGTVEGGLVAAAHEVNRANDILETDFGVHLTLAARNDRLILTRPEDDPFEASEPGPASVEFINRRIGESAYDIGHTLTDIFGGYSETGTSCSNDLSADFHATHKAAGWSGHAHPDTEPYAQDFMLHVLGSQLGAWPTANGCIRFTLDDRAFEPGSGSTAMGYAPTRCGGEAQWLQPRSDAYFHAANIAQVRSWLASRGGSCARKRLGKASAPWIDPASVAEEAVIPARTPFLLDARVFPGEPGRRLTYTWEQMDAGPEQKGALKDDSQGPLFRSMPPATTSQRIFPRLAALLGREDAAPGEALPTTNRLLNFRLTVRDNGGDDATTAHADRRLRVVDTGRPFSMAMPAAATRLAPGASLAVQWDVAGTTQPPISCHFLDVHLSVDGGETWPYELARDERNDGEATLVLPNEVPPTDKGRLRIRCDWRPFFAVSPGDFSIG